MKDFIKKTTNRTKVYLQEEFSKYDHIKTNFSDNHHALVVGQYYCKTGVGNSIKDIYLYHGEQTNSLCLKSYLLRLFGVTLGKIDGNGFI